MEKTEVLLRNLPHIQAHPSPTPIKAVLRAPNCIQIERVLFALAIIYSIQHDLVLSSSAPIALSLLVCVDFPSEQWQRKRQKINHSGIYFRCGKCVSGKLNKRREEKTFYFAIFTHWWFHLSIICSSIFIRYPSFRLSLPFFHTRLAGKRESSARRW